MRVFKKHLILSVNLAQNHGTFKGNFPGVSAALPEAAEKAGDGQRLYRQGLQARRGGLCEPPVCAERHPPPHHEHGAAAHKKAAAHERAGRPLLPAGEKHRADGRYPRPRGGVPQRRGRHTHDARDPCDGAFAPVPCRQDRPLSFRAREYRGHPHGLGPARHRQAANSGGDPDQAPFPHAGGVRDCQAAHADRCKAHHRLADLSERTARQVCH